MSASSRADRIFLHALAGVVVGFLVFGIASASRADDAQAEEIGELVTRAVEHRRRGEDAEALALLLEADRLGSSPPLHAQIGLAAQALGRWVEAERRLIEALAHDDAWIAAHRSPLESALESVRDHLGWLEVRCDVAGASLFVQGASVGPLPLPGPLRMAVGTAVVEVRAPGHHALRRTVSIDARRLSREEVALVPLPPVETVVPSSSEPAQRITTTTRTEESLSPGLRPAGWALLTVGTAAVAAGAVAWIVRERAVREWNDDARCDVDPALDRQAECGSLRDRYVLGQRAAATLFGVGGAMVLTGVVLLWAGKRPPPSRATACAIDLLPLSVGCRISF